MNEPNKLKILAIIPSGFCFGLQHITVDFFSNFPASIESHFLLTRWGDGQLAKLLDEKKIPYSRSWLGMFSRKMDLLNMKMSLLALIKLPRLYIDFLRLQKKFDPDILYFANHHELILLYPVLFLTKRKIVCHMHDPTPAIPFQKRNFKWYGKKVNRFISISDNVRSRTIALGAAPEKVTTVHNGIIIPGLKKENRLNEFTQKAGWGNDVFVIGITGQMTATKGHNDLLSAFKIVLTKNPMARLVIGGKFQEPMYAELQKKIEEWQLGKFVYFTGWLTDVSVFFQNIDVYVLASRHEEGYGLVVAEAMAHEVPVVITASGGAIEIVEQGKSGYIIPKGDIEAMAEKLLELSNDKEKCLNMGINAKMRIKEYFNIEHQTSELSSLLIEVKRT